jgi:hypothetical protein
MSEYRQFILQIYIQLFTIHMCSSDYTTINKLTCDRVYTEGWRQSPHNTIYITVVTIQDVSGAIKFFVRN